LIAQPARVPLALFGPNTSVIPVLLYGTGANGMSVFINTLMGILKDYAAAAPISNFMPYRPTSYRLAML